MLNESLIDKTINGYNVIIYEDDDGYINLDINCPCGETIKALEFLDNFYTAERLANRHTRLLGDFKQHCQKEA